MARSRRAKAPLKTEEPANPATEVPNSWVRNNLWPTIGTLVGTVLGALATALPVRLADGFQAEDWGSLGGTVALAVFGYVATIWDRRAGKDVPYTQPPE